MLERYAYYLKDGEYRLVQVIDQRGGNICDVCLHNAGGQPGKIITTNRLNLFPIENPNIREILGLPPLIDNRQSSIDNLSLASPQAAANNLPPRSAGGIKRGVP